METKKSLNEAILRAHESTEKNNQPQDMLFAIATPKQETYDHNTHQAPLNESHINLMQSWVNLRAMECSLDSRKHNDDPNEEQA